MFIQAAPYIPEAAPAQPVAATTTTLTSSPTTAAHASRAARPTATPLAPGTTFTTHTATYRVLDHRTLTMLGDTLPGYTEYVVRRTYHNNPHTSRVLVCADATVVEWLAESGAILAAGEQAASASGHHVDALA